LHPEFGYFCPTPRLRRKLRMVFFSSIFAVVALMAGLEMLWDGAEPAAQSELALARVESVDSAVAGVPVTAETRPPEAAFAQGTEIEPIKASCPDKTADQLDGHCNSGKARKPRTLPGAAERPAMAEPRAHGDGSARDGPPQVAPALTVPSVSRASARPAESVASPAPGASATPAAKQSRKTARSPPSRRDQNANSSRRDPGVQQVGGGFARRGPGTLFW
jgi:hypothetical protein